MPRSLGVRQLRSRRCGCSKCLSTYPSPERTPTKTCIGSWQARYYDEAGNRIPITRKRKQDAIDARNAAMAAVDAGIHLDPKRGQVRLGEWRETWRAGRNVEAHTAHSDTSRWNARVGPKWAGIPLKAITHQRVQNWTVEMEREGLEPGYVKACVGLLNLMLEAAKRDQRIMVNPCEGIVFDRGRGRPSAPERPPSVEEIEAVAARMRPSGRRRGQVDVYSRIPGFLAETGLRSEEAFGLYPDCIDLDGRWITVRRVLENVGGRKAIRDYPKSDAGCRQVPLTRRAAGLLAEHFEVQEPVEGMPVFRAPRGGLIDRGTFYNRWLAAAVAAGVHVEVELPSGLSDHWPTVHMLRHAFVSRLENGGVPMSIVKVVCGHAKPKGRDVTWTYIHAPEDPAVYGPIVLAALEGEPAGPVGRALRLVS